LRVRRALRGSRLVSNRVTVAIFGVVGAKCSDGGPCRNVSDAVGVVVSVGSETQSHTLSLIEQIFKVRRYIHLIRGHPAWLYF
jgi:hypothetical protein